MNTVKMQLCTTVADVVPAKVERFKAKGWIILEDGKRIPYVKPPEPAKVDAKDEPEGCC
jgi:hypothetical protein